MVKAGTQFELVVADIVRELEPGAKVEQGAWIDGPDGRRDCDVYVEGTVAGVQRKIQIECKDYNPKKARPIGIGIVDALESKCRDLNMDKAFLCSNVGFTRDAVSKAKRENIGLIGVLNKADDRVRYKIWDEIYVRRVNFGGGKFIFGPEFQNKPKLESIIYNNIPLYQWLLHRAEIFLGLNEVVSGTHTLRFRLKKPLLILVGEIQQRLDWMSVTFEVSGGWFAQKVEIDATSGLYDWLNKQFHAAPGPGNISYKDVDIDNMARPVDLPPNHDPLNPSAGVEGLKIIISNVQCIKKAKDIPLLNQLILDEDLVDQRNDIDTEAFYQPK